MGLPPFLLKENNRLGKVYFLSEASKGPASPVSQHTFRQLVIESPGADYFSTKRLNQFESRGRQIVFDDTSPTLSVRNCCNKIPQSRQVFPLGNIPIRILIHNDYGHVPYRYDHNGNVGSSFSTLEKEETLKHINGMNENVQGTNRWHTVCFSPVTSKRTEGIDHPYKISARRGL
jgi:hypothetical protein